MIPPLGFKVLYYLILASGWKFMEFKIKMSFNYKINKVIFIFIHSLLNYQLLKTDLVIFGRLRFKHNTNITDILTTTIYNQFFWN